MKVIHIVDNINLINLGIWEAAISTAPILAKEYRCNSWLIYPFVENDPEIPFLIKLPIKNTSISQIRNLIVSNDFFLHDTVIVSHGCWSFATRWAYKLNKLGFKWIYTPQGMLEPWSISQKRIKKYFYYKLIEYKYSKNADVVRSVSVPEFENLQKQFANVVLIPNGVNIPLWQKEIASSIPVFLFIARLHKKKGIIPLIQAWKNVVGSCSSKGLLLIAGPDDGELPEVLKLIRGVPSIKYLGSVYGKEKIDILQRSDFYILPSYSEGFPTSVIEAMANSLIPLVSNGCNFPDIFNLNLGFNLEPNIQSISICLNRAFALTINEMQELSKKNKNLIKECYSLDVIASLQFNLYDSLLKP